MIYVLWAIVAISLSFF